MSSQNRSIFFTRSQEANDKNEGEIVKNDKYDVEMILPNQSTANNYQIIFCKDANITKGYYIGWWIKTKSGYIREIVEYSGPNRVATLDKELPIEKSKDDIIYLYSKSNSVIYYDEDSKTFLLGFSANSDLLSRNIDLTNLKISKLESEGIYLNNGEIEINNTQDSINCSSGGTIYTNGGASIQKKLFVGKNIIISENEINNITGDIYIQKLDSAFIHLESNDNNYIQFSNNKRGCEYKIGNFENNFQLIKNNQVYFNISENGRVGLNTTQGLDDIYYYS